MSEPELASVSVAELALRLVALHGTATYAAYVVAARDVASVLIELEDELSFVDDGLELAILSAPRVEALLDPHAAQILLVDATAFTKADWMLLDRRRSSLARAGVMLFVTSPESFALLMHGVANLTSWLAFASQHDDALPSAASVTEQRLVALRAWARKTDHEVVRDAIAGVLPADPEYAEWLVLLGRGDLLELSGT
jgi:hypothetical protein